jgi:hypothetical protein
VRQLQEPKSAPPRRWRAGPLVRRRGPSKPCRGAAAPWPSSGQRRPWPTCRPCIRVATGIAAVPVTRPELRGKHNPEPICRSLPGSGAACSLESARTREAGVAREMLVAEEKRVSRDGIASRPRRGCLDCCSVTPDAVTLARLATSAMGPLQAAAPTHGCSSQRKQKRAARSTGAESYRLELPRISPTL